MPFKIDKKGRWINGTLEGHCFDRKLALALVRYFKKKGQKNIVDLGCGPGWYVKTLKKKGLTAKGYDGNPYTPDISARILADGTCCEQLDLSKKVRFDNQFDIVLSLEVGEHIPEKYEHIYLDNVTRNAINYVVLSWAIEGQNGDGHVNCRNNDYVINQMENRGFFIDVKASNNLRERATLPWFKNTIMVFSKTRPENKASASQINLITFQKQQENPITSYILGKPFTGDIYIEKAFLKLKKQYNIVNVIETGTRIGATFAWLYNHFDHVYTCEIDEKYYQIACALIFGSHTNANNFPQEIVNPPNMGEMVMKNMDTVTFLKEVCTNLNGESIFFLNAHCLNNSPLLDELKAISDAKLKPAVIVIPDFKTDHPAILGFNTYDNLACDLPWIKPSIDSIYGADWSFSYNTPKAATGALRGIIYIERGC
jgi:SAM-dependent methyltransferase